MVIKHFIENREGTRVSRGLFTNVENGSNTEPSTDQLCIEFW